ncbi:hypothetical protein ACWCQK_34395 [Streptomyces sp. NPDC002306]
MAMWAAATVPLPGICTPSAIALATGTALAADRPHFQAMDFATDRMDELPDSAYVVITRRLAFRPITHKDIFWDRVRQLLVPGVTFWVVTELADR